MTGADTISLRYLQQGGQTAGDVVSWLTEFITAARSSLDIAIYDCRLNDTSAAEMRRVLADRIAAGVTIRLIYDASAIKPQSSAGLENLGVDPAPIDIADRVAELGLPNVIPIASALGLMHHKYIVRDGQSVWTGSLNWTDDSMTRMENIAIQIANPQLASFFARDFEQLWQRQEIGATGAFNTDPAQLTSQGDRAMTDVDFSPGRGEQIDQWIAKYVLGAQKRIVICSMLINSSSLLRALLTQLDRGQVSISGVYDKTQMEGVLDQWRAAERLAWKVEAVQRVVADAHLAGKLSTPYRPDSIHDFMHNKSLIIDDTVISGSYNLSHSAMTNAENMLAITSSSLAQEVCEYVDRLRSLYGAP